jgi:hypothetical protein
MRKNSFAQNHKVLFLSAFLTSNILNTETGFRLRDIQFYFELFANWRELEKISPDFGVQLTQIKRMVQHFKLNGLLVGTRNGSRESFKFSLEGTLQLLEELVACDESLCVEDVIFVQYFIKTYKPYLIQYLLPTESPVKPQVRDRINFLVEHDGVVKNQIIILDCLLKDLKSRIRESEEIISFVKSKVEAGEALPKVIQQMNKQFIYQFSHRKSFSEVYGALPDALQDYEIREGMQHRNNNLFAKLIRSYETQRAFLVSLLP